jgi:hypothetical protein
VFVALMLLVYEALSYVHPPPDAPVNIHKGMYVYIPSGLIL